MKKRIQKILKNNFFFKSIILSFLISANLFSQQPAFNWLGTLGGNSSRACGVSADGSVVVGVSTDSNNEQRAFRWTTDKGMENLGTLGGIESIANDISADGSIIVGYSTDSNEIIRAFKWTAETGMQDIGAGDWTQAEAISDDGSVIIINNTEDRYAYRWTDSGEMENLGTLGGNKTTAHDVSSDGTVVVGYSYDSDGNPYAFRWEAGSGIQSIGTFFSFARGVSADGNTVTGFELGALGLNRAFRWTKSGGFEYNIAGNFSYGLSASGDGDIIVGDGRDGAFRLSGSSGFEYLHQVYSNIINPGSKLSAAFDISPNGLYIIGNGTNAATSRGEGFLLAVNNVTSTDEKIFNPKDFSLLQNYPNPFNPTTSINYKLAKSENVSLKVYDIIGNEVATLVNEFKPAGSYEVSFDASHLSSGIYLYKLQAGSFVQTRKMTLLK